MTNSQQVDERTRLLRWLQAELVRLREALAHVQKQTQGVVEAEEVRPLSPEQRARAAALRREGDRLRAELDNLRVEFERLRAQRPE